MSTHFTDILDTALARVANNETLSTILADYPQQKRALQPLLKAAQLVSAADEVILPEPELQATDRLAFLKQFEQLPVPTTPKFQDRLRGYMVHQFPWLSSNPTISRKEPKRMSALALKAGLILTILFGTVGGTAVLAAESLPDSPIYPVKLALEDTRLALTNDDADRAALHITLGEKRAAEIINLIQTGTMPEAATQTRLEAHINSALNIAAQQPEEAMLPLLIQAQNMVQTQLQIMANEESEPAKKMLGQANGFLYRAGQEIEEGLKNPQIFRSRYGNIPEGKVPQENGPCQSNDCDPAGAQNQFGLDPENRSPNNDCQQEPCEPAGEQNQYGLDPENDGHHGPGDGICAGDDCNQYQHRHEGQPLEPYQYQYQQNGDDECANGDCDPGDNNVNHGDGNNGNVGDGNNGDGNNGDGSNDDGNNGDGNNGDGNNGGTGGNGGK